MCRAWSAMLACPQVISANVQALRDAQQRHSPAVALASCGWCGRALGGQGGWRRMWEGDRGKERPLEVATSVAGPGSVDVCVSPRLPFRLVSVGPANHTSTGWARPEPLRHAHSHAAETHRGPLAPTSPAGPAPGGSPGQPSGRRWGEHTGPAGGGGRGGRHRRAVRGGGVAGGWPARGVAGLQLVAGSGALQGAASLLPALCLLLQHHPLPPPCRACRSPRNPRLTRILSPWNLTTIRGR